MIPGQWQSKRLVNFDYNENLCDPTIESDTEHHFQFLQFFKCKFVSRVQAKLPGVSSSSESESLVTDGQVQIYRWGEPGWAKITQPPNSSTNPSHRSTRVNDDISWTVGKLGHKAIALWMPSWRWALGSSSHLSDMRKWWWYLNDTENYGVHTHTYR